MSDGWIIGPGDMVPSHTPSIPIPAGTTLASDEWTLSDSFWLQLEAMPLLGGIFTAIQAPQNTATAKAANIVIAKTGIPNPSGKDIADFFAQLAAMLATVGTIAAYGAVAVGLYYGYKIVKEIKS
jgi:hypothetical protein